MATERDYTVRVTYTVERMITVKAGLPGEAIERARTVADRETLADVLDRWYAGEDVGAIVFPLPEAYIVPGPVEV